MCIGDRISTWGALAGIGNVALLFLGGVGRLSGIVVGGLLTPGGLTESSSADATLLRTAVSGMLMIFFAARAPDGITGLAAAGGHKLVGRFRGRPKNRIASG